MNQMKANPDKPSPAANLSKAKTAPSQRSRADQAAKSPASAEHPESSRKAKAMRRAAQVLAHTPDIREAKVRALQQAVESGTYNVTAEQIAEKMLNEAVRKELP